MKYLKIFVLLLVAFFTIPLVSAKEKTVSFIEYKKGFYYDERVLKEEGLTKQMNLTGDRKYEETFILRNDSNVKKEVFLSLESMAEDGSYNDIMEYCHLKVVLDGKTLYDGSANIMDYASEKDKLLELVSLGKLEEKSQQKLEIELTLSGEYQNSSKNKFAYVTSSFYTKDKQKNYVLIEKATPQMIYNFLDVWVFCGVCVFIGILLLSIYYIGKHSNKKKDKEKKEDKKADNDKDKNDTK